MTVPSSASEPDRLGLPTPTSDSDSDLRLRRSALRLRVWIWHREIGRSGDLGNGRRQSSEDSSKAIERLLPIHEAQVVTYLRPAPLLSASS
jgi:hypothetical protein